MIKMQMKTLMPWDITVARAAPEAPILRPFTKAMSPPMLSAAAMPTAMRGVLESPMPLNRLLSRL